MKGRTVEGGKKEKRSILSMKYLHNINKVDNVAVSGRRSCMGEQLAQQEIYLFLAAVVQNFIIQPPEGCDEMICGEKVDVMVSPQHFNVRFIPRSDN